MTVSRRANARKRRARGEEFLRDAAGRLSHFNSYRKENRWEIIRGNDLNRKATTDAATASIRSSHCELANGMKKYGMMSLSYGANDGR